MSYQPAIHLPPQPERQPLRAGGNAFEAALAACSSDFGLHQVAADSRTDATALAVY
jgi:hypothetical protein